MSSLSSVPVATRRRAAVALALISLLLLAMGLIPWLRAAPGVVRGFAVVALICALALALMARGLLTSVRSATREARLDAAAIAAVAEAGQTMCSCGHAHDPDELHVMDAPPCPSGETCTRTCDTCVLSGPRN